MGLVESLESGISGLIWKGIKHAGTALAGVATAILAKKLNYNLAVEHQTAIALFATGLLGAGLKKLKDKFPTKLSWL